MRENGQRWCLGWPLVDWCHENWCAQFSAPTVRFAGLWSSWTWNYRQNPLIEKNSDWAKLSNKLHCVQCNLASTVWLRKWPCLTRTKVTKVSLGNIGWTGDQNRQAAWGCCFLLQENNVTVPNKDRKIALFSWSFAIHFPEASVLEFFSTDRNRGHWRDCDESHKKFVIMNSLSLQLRICTHSSRVRVFRTLPFLWAEYSSQPENSSVEKLRPLFLFILHCV